jgi:hypothetical protein
MTPIMAASPTPLYPRFMDSPTAADLERLIALEESVRTRLAAVAENPAAVLAAGQEVLDFAALEERLFFPILPLLDVHAREQLGDEHRLLADDLQLLHHLIATSPESPDVDTLASALTRRLRDHMERDSRLLAQGLRLAAARR